MIPINQRRERKTMTRSIRIAFVLFVVWTAVAALAQEGAKKSFEQLKSLAGSWEGKNSMGEALQVSFKVTSGGSALLSEIQGHGEDMITMFHLDGPDKLEL